MAKYECRVCGYIYNEQYGGKTFEEMYSCPICDADKSSFKVIEEEAPEKINVWNLSDEEDDGTGAVVRKEQKEPVATQEVFFEAEDEETVAPVEESTVEKESTAKTEFVVERRQEFWTTSDKEQEKVEEASEKPVSTWGVGSVERVIDTEHPNQTETDTGAKTEVQMEEPVRSDAIETIYGNATPVLTEEEMKKAEEEKEAEEQRNFLNVNGGVVQTVIEPKEEPKTSEALPNETKAEEPQGTPWKPIPFDTMPQTEKTVEAVSDASKAEEDVKAEPEEEEAFEFVEADAASAETDGSIPDFFHSSVEDFNQFGKSEETFFDDSIEDGMEEGQEDFYTVNEASSEVMEEAAGEYKEIIPENENVRNFENIPADETEEIFFEENIIEEGQGGTEEADIPSEAPVEEAPAEEVQAAENAEVPVEEVYAAENMDMHVEEAPIVENTEIPVGEVKTEIPIKEEAPMQENSQIEEEVVVYSMLKGRTKYSILCDEEARKMFDSYSVGEETVSNGLEDIIILPAQLNPMPLPDEVPVECRTTIGRFTNCPVEVLQPFCFSKLILWGEHIPGRNNDEDLSSQALILIKGKEGHIPDISSKEEFRREVLSAKVRSGGTPVGIDLIAGRIEKDLEACVYAGVDFVILNDVTSRILPYALRRAKNYLNRVNSKIEILVCVDALKDAQELAKMLAMGADLVLIERGFDLKMSNRITEDLIEITRSTGHRNVHDINMTDICTIDSDIAANTDIDHV